MNSMFTSNANIQIRLLRNDTPEDDDRIVFHYKGEDTYQLYYKIGFTTGKVNPVYMTVLNGEELDTYLYSLFTLLVRDKDPYKKIQFQIPCFPILLYSIEDLRQGKIRSALNQIMPILKQASKC